MNTPKYPKPGQENPNATTDQPNRSIYEGVAQILELIQLGAMAQTVTPEQMEQLIDQTVDQILHAYKQHGFELPKPTFVYVDQQCPLNPSLTAKVRGEEKYDEQIESFLIPLMNRQFYGTLDIKVSQEAAVEMGTKDKEKKMQLRAQLKKEQEPNTEADITFYLPSRLNPEQMKRIVAEKLWIMIEQQHNLPTISEPIHKGTAAFAAQYILEEDEPQNDDPINATALTIVEESLQSSGDPLHLMLTEDYRKWLAGRFRSNLFPFIQHIILNTPFNLDEGKMLVHFNLINDPDYADFVAEPTLENMLATSRKKGYNKLAEELEAQDTTQLIRFFREAITLQ